MLDTMQLTGIMTDPTPRSAPPEHGGANQLLGVVRPDGEFTEQVDWLNERRTPLDVVRERIPGRQDISVRKLGLVLGSLVVLTGGLVAGTIMTSTGATPTDTGHAGFGAAHRLVENPNSLHLSPARTFPIPAKPLVALANPTSTHEVFGYIPYWSLPDWQSFPYRDFSTVAYFSVNVNPNGSIEQSGPGWNGYESEDFVNLINAAHQAGDRVVLTANDFSEASLYTLTHNPNAGVVLGTELLELVQTKGLDGVNLDLEGTGSGDQAGLDHLVSQVDFMLHSVDPHYQLTMSTYASAAGDPNGFYDIPGLSKWVNAFFVMAYDVSQGPTGSQGANDDAAYVAQYVSAAGANKVIFGLPLFGYDEPTKGPALGERASGPEAPVTYAQAVASGPTYWNAATKTAWTSYQSGGQWHQVFFDNANTIEAKVQLASRSDLLGVGVWALGMEGADNSMLGLLDGGSASLRTPPEGPTTSSAAANINRRIKSRNGAAGAGSVQSTSTTTSGAVNPGGKGRSRKHGSTTPSSSSTTTSLVPRTTTTTTTTVPTVSTSTTLGPGQSQSNGSTATSAATSQ
jgi:hypothetical protein